MKQIYDRKQTESVVFQNLPDEDDGDEYENRIRAIIGKVFPQLSAMHNVPVTWFYSAKCYADWGSSNINNWSFAIETPDGAAAIIGFDDSQTDDMLDVGVLEVSGTVPDIREFITGEPNPYELPADWTPGDLQCGLSGIVAITDSEIPESLHKVGTADKIIRLGHTGWFRDEFQDETITGIVFETDLSEVQEDAGYDPRYYAAAVDNGGSAIWIDIADPCDSDTDAAIRADNMAESIAKYEKEYSSAWHTGQDARHKRMEAYRAGLIFVRQMRLARDIRTEFGNGILYRNAKSVADECRCEYVGLRRDAIRYCDEHRPTSGTEFHAHYVEGFESV